jgi:hypothetical protein
MTESREFPAGTVLKMNGIPVALTEAAKIETHPSNWPLIEDRPDGGCRADPGETVLA